MSDPLSQQLSPPQWVAFASFAVALVVVGTRFGWRVGRHAITVAHEGGHAAIALLSGRRLSGVRLHSDSSGLTLSAGRPRGLGMIATLAAGYVTPSLLGLGAAWLVATRHVSAMLVIVLVLLVALLFAVRNVFGVCLVLVCGAGVFVAAFHGSPTVRGFVAWAITWGLLLGGGRPVWEAARAPRRRPGVMSDADQLAALTHVPGVMWLGLFGLVAAGSLIAGGRWLLISVR